MLRCRLRCILIFVCACAFLSLGSHSALSTSARADGGELSPGGAADGLADDDALSRRLLAAGENEKPSPIGSEPTLIEFAGGKRGSGKYHEFFNLYELNLDVEEGAQYEFTLTSEAARRAIIEVRLGNDRKLFDGSGTLGAKGTWRMSKKAPKGSLRVRIIANVPGEAMLSVRKV